ncbi:hypothetical protein NOI24_08370 [Neorhizobium galegae]|uniref:hypothetical protein n=1 Tax=Neorhizobium galegae TaxID=399 RepID=UPI0021062433|nr:hypothetical protein [Neorhizobium galegae]MCQ1771311.1 hypothetical protein [Neorhizobium galegae]MCQ1799803.1 hypothetical protein [Neorhizobium galegae]
MPIRRHAGKRRTSAGIDAWETYLECGTDFFDDLVDAGIVTESRQKPSDADAYAAWLTFADELLHRWKSSRHPDQDESWAIREFGDPRSTGKRRRR